MLRKSVIGYKEVFCNMENYDTRDTRTGLIGQMVFQHLYETRLAYTRLTA